MSLVRSYSSSLSRSSMVSTSPSSFAPSHRRPQCFCQFRLKQPEPQQQQQQGNVVHQARPFLAHVQKDGSQKQMGIRRLGSPPKDQQQESRRQLQHPLERQSSNRRVGSPPKEALQRQTSTRRVGSPPPAPTKSGSPTPAQGKRSNPVLQEEAGTPRPRPGHLSPRGPGARSGNQIPRAPVLGTGTAAIGGGRPPGITFLQPRGSSSQFLYVPKGSSMEVCAPKGSSIEAEPAMEPVRAQPGANLVHDERQRDSTRSAHKPSSIIVRPSYHQQAADNALPASTTENLVQDVKNSSEQVQSDTASTASQEHVQADTVSNSSQDDTCTWLDHMNFDRTQDALVWTPLAGASPDPTPANTVLWTPRVGAGKEHVATDTSKSELNPGGASPDPTPATVLWTPRVGPCKQHVSSDNTSADMSKSEASPPGAGLDANPAALVWTPRVGACKHPVNSDTMQPKPSPQTGPSPCVGASPEDISFETTTAAPDAPTLTNQVSAAEVCSQQASGGQDETESAKDGSTSAANASADQKQGGDVNNASSGAASPRAPRCLARSPQQRVLRSRSPPSDKRVFEPVRGFNRMSQGSLEAFAAECQNVCQTYEKNLHELQLICSAIDRTAQSPRAGTSRQSNCGTPDSSCRPGGRGTVRTSRTSGGSKSTTPDQSWRSLHESKKASTPERNWRMTAGRKDAGTPERNWRSAVRKEASTPERSVRAPCLNQGPESNRGHRGTDASSQERTPRPGMVAFGSSKGSTQSLSTRAACRTQGMQVISRTDSYIPDLSRPGKDEPVIQSLLAKGFLTQTPAGWMNDPVGVPDDLAHVRTMFAAQVPEATALSVHRVKHDGHSLLFKAVQETMESKTECILWHGTSMDCVRNIALNGFNRNYCGRHGMKLGYGTYFSSSADYSVRFCDRRATKRVMFLSKVLVGSWTKGSQEMKEPPFRDNEGMVRYDSTVDSVESPNIFCVFRDYQAVPLYLIEFSGPS
mmetsp:Transcript_51817/g.94839  ORF Transcript_51817/g.94839 Transcript_51817/m.94839 type:complete len:978 (-) Transcript_51817:356-3289(-)